MALPSRKPVSSPQLSGEVPDTFTTNDKHGLSQLTRALDSPEANSRTCFTDEEVDEISNILRGQGQETWSKVPRLYIVLRKIGQLHVLDALIDQAVNDFWFPFEPRSVPRLLNAAVHQNFLTAQDSVLNIAMKMEKDLGNPNRHHHFKGRDTIPFNEVANLGSGGYGEVHKIVSRFSGQEYARKRFRRVRGSSKTSAQTFMNELSILKKIRHQHCVTLVTSYTDAKYFGIIMSPVADCNLATYCLKVAKDPSLKSTLRSFYGCLTGALCYLHEEKVRHRDVKPENILVKGEKVYFTDFGISLNWENLSGGTTQTNPTKTLAYCAPEVAKDEPRNDSSDVWSLGCIFLEITTILKGLSLVDLRQHFKAQTDSWAFCKNEPQIETWIKKLKTLGDELDNHPLQWVESIVGGKKDVRPTAFELFHQCMETISDAEGDAMPFCAGCCQLPNYDDSDGGSHAEDDEIWDTLASEGATNPTTTSEILVKGDMWPSNSPLGTECRESDSTPFPSSLQPQQQESTDPCRGRPVRSDSSWSANQASNELFLNPNPENADGPELESMRRAPSRTEPVWSTNSLNDAPPMPVIKDEPQEMGLEQSPPQIRPSGELNRSYSTPAEPFAQISLKPDSTPNTEPEQRHTTSRFSRRGLMGRVSSDGATSYMRSFKKAIPSAEMGSSIKKAMPTVEIGSSIKKAMPTVDGMGVSIRKKIPTVEMGAMLMKSSKECKMPKEQAAKEQATREEQADLVASPKATESQELISFEEPARAEEASPERVQTQLVYTGNLHRCLPVLTANDWKSPETMMSAMGRSQNLLTCLMESYPELYDAVKASDMTRFNEIMTLLINNGLDIKIGQPTPMDPVRRLPMYHVVSWSKNNTYQSLFQIMIQKGNLVDEGSLPYTQSVFFQAANQGSLWAVADLVASDVRKHLHWACWTMHGAVHGGHMDILKYLETYNIFRAATICFHCGFTILSAAAHYGQEGMVKYLLEKNSITATILEHVWQGGTPLFDACRIGQANIGKSLLDRGASAAFRTKGDYPGYPNYLPLRVACVAGHAAMVKVLLESPEGKKSLDGMSNEYTPLHDVCKQGNVEIATLLLTYGANPNARSRSFWTPLHYAAQKGSAELVSLLLEHGSEAYARTGIGGHITPMRLAERGRHQDVMRLLAKAKVERRIEKKSLSATTTDGMMTTSEGMTNASSMMMITTRTAAL